MFDTVRSVLTKSPFFVENAQDQTQIVDPGAMQTKPNGRRTQTFTLRFRKD